MFTGIIEAQGTVSSLKRDGTNLILGISSSISQELKIDQSVAHNGVCLTVTSLLDNCHEVVAVNETLLKSNVRTLQVGDKVNLERCMVANGRFDGHIVQGHVDQTAELVSIKDQHGSWIFAFEYDLASGNITVEKGSICINGVSLTCFNVSDTGFSVAIIPYTYEHTNFNQLVVGDSVNLEFDVVGKYVKRLLGK